MYKNKEINVIVAFDLNGAIGYKNKLLWHIPDDLKFFKSKTIGTSVIMGMNTYQSIGKPLIDRENIILTSKPEYYSNLSADNELLLIDSFDKAIEEATHDSVFIIGGESVYDLIFSSEYIDIIDNVYVTEVDVCIENYDKLFPKNILEDNFNCESNRIINNGDYKISFKKYKYVNK